MNAKMSRNFRLIATAVAKDRAEYEYYYKVFKRVYSSAKRPGEYYLACVRLAEMFTKDKLEAVKEHFNDPDITEEKAGSITNEDSQSGKEDNGQERNPSS